MIKSLTKEIYSIGFIESANDSDYIFKETCDQKVIWIDWNGYKDGWFADPFILSADTSRIEVLVEEWVNKLGKGRISKLTIEANTYKLQCVKPILESDTHFSFPNIWKENGVIYVYPEKPMEVSISINITEGKFSVVYPKFNEDNNSWKIKGNPNGDIEINNRKYPYLFYECDSYFNQETNEGFIVDENNAECFLEEKLKYLGLNDKEITDFITFWLPVLLKNKLLLFISITALKNSNLASVLERLKASLFSLYDQ